MAHKFEHNFDKERAKVIEEQEWEKYRSNYEKSPTDFLAAWEFLSFHPIFRGTQPLADYRFGMNLRIDVVRVNLTTNEIEDNPALNTKTQVWLECGPTYLWDEVGDEHVWAHTPDGVMDNVHDIKLDTNGDSFEDAIVNLAEKVRLEYGYDRSRIHKQPPEE